VVDYVGGIFFLAQLPIITSTQGMRFPGGREGVCKTLKNYGFDSHLCLLDNRIEKGMDEILQALRLGSQVESRTEDNDSVDTSIE
jgi:hypothetical protein